MTTAPAATKAPKARSPRYPIIGLKSAIDRVQRVYAEDYQNKIQTLDAAKHMGFGTLNGKTLGVISALRKYGLLDGSDGTVRVSDLALKIIAHAAGDEERRHAILEAANGPELFAAIEKKWPGGKVSDQALKSFLLTEKFLPDATDIAIRSYRETMALVEAEVVGLQLRPPKEEDEITPDPAAAKEPPVHTLPSMTSPPSPPKAGMQRAEFPLPEGMARLELPSVMSAESYEELEAWLQLLLRRTKRSVQAN